MKKSRFTRWLMLTAAIGLPLALVFADDGQINILIDPATGYMITKPGSYVVVADVTMTADVSAIKVHRTVDGVSIDLGGHTLTGTGGGSVDGIDANDSDRIHVFNGRVAGFSGDGIDISGSAYVHDVTVADNGGTGIECNENALIERCVAIGNNKTGGEAGIRVFDGGTVRDCTAVANNPTSSGATRGIWARGPGATIMGNRCSDNVSPDSFASGIEVNATNANSTIIDNVCDGNTSGGSGDAAGIKVDSGCTIVNNVCANNTSSGSGDGYGIWVTSGSSTLRSNTCVGNREGPSGGGTSFGIDAGSGSSVIGNVCADNSAQSPAGIGIGIAVADGCLVRENVCRNNDGVGGESIAAGIIVFEAEGAGDDNRIENNVCSEHSGATASAGILILGSNNLVQGNFTSGNEDGGIFTDGGDNLLVSNRASDNAIAFGIDAGDSFGPVIDATASGDITTSNTLANIFF